MQLLIVRHGEAEMAAASDEVRNLTPRGRDVTVALAQALQKKHFRPTQIWASPLVRAQQTASILRERLAFAPALRECSAMIPEGDVRRCLELLQRENAGETIMLVSHQPFVTQLISWLCDASMQADGDVPSLTTSAAILLQLPEIDAGCAEQQWVLFPPLFQSSP
jgi:phosphohistidine phosphatase